MIPAAMSAPASTVSPSDGRLIPTNTPIPPKITAMIPRAVQRPLAFAGGSVNQPCCTTCFSSRVSNPVTSLPSVRSSFGSMSSVPPPMFRRRLSRNSVPSSIGRARARSSRDISTGSCVDACVVRIDSCVLFAMRPVCSASNSIRPRDARSRLAVVSARRDDLPSRMTAPAAGVRPAGRRRDVDRRVVEVDGVSPVAVPRDQRAADEQHEQQRRDEQAEDRVELPEEGEGPGVLGRRGGIDLLHRHQQRAIEVAPLEQRQHVVLVDLLAIRVGQELVGEPGPGVQLHLAVARVVRVEVEQDHEAVVEALPADAPLVHQRLRVVLGRRRVLAARRQLRVDGDLGTGPLLDRVDRGLDLLLGRAAQAPAVS